MRVRKDFILKGYQVHTNGVVDDRAEERYIKNARLWG